MSEVPLLVRFNCRVVHLNQNAGWAERLANACLSRAWLFVYFIEVEDIQLPYSLAFLQNDGSHKPQPS